VSSRRPPLFLVSVAFKVAQTVAGNAGSLPCTAGSASAAADHSAVVVPVPLSPDPLVPPVLVPPVLFPPVPVPPLFVPLPEPAPELELPSSPPPQPANR